MIKLIKFISISLLVVIFTNCKQQNIADQKKENSQDVIITSPEVLTSKDDEEDWKNAQPMEPPAPLDVRLMALNDSAKAAWKDLTMLDNKKYAAIDLITKEFKKMKNINKSLLDSVIMLKKKCVAIRYNETTLNNTAILDEYDKSVEILMDKLDRLETTNNKYIYDCRKCLDVFEEIRQLDAQDLPQRIHFISAARDLNTLLEKEKAEIEKLSEKHKAIKPFVLFSE
jgi:hypothetical protein